MSEARLNKQTAPSRWSLWWRKFRQNKVAMGGGAVILLLLVIMVFADFLSPADPTEQNLTLRHAPPQAIRFGDAFTPYVQSYTLSVNEETLRRTYHPNGARNPLQFFVKGYDYRFLGIFAADLHLFSGTNGPVFLLGSDRFGRDMLSRTLFGMRVSLTIGIASVAVSLMIGTVLGTVSGYFGGAVDMFIQRIVEFLEGFPKVPLWLALSAAFPPEWASTRVFFFMLLILALLNWTGLARQIRGKVLSFRQEDYVTAARAMGASHWQIMVSHLIPASTSHILVAAILKVRKMILVESFLSFLGLGIRPPMTSLGVLLREAQNVRSVLHHAWLLLPGLVIVVAVLALNFLGDGLRDAADPHAR